MDDLLSEEQLDEQMKIAGIEPPYREEDKIPIVKYIESYIKRNGYVNTRYATGMTIKGKRFTNNEHRDAFYESVSAMLVNTGKYIREPNKNEDKGYNILLNPTYFNNRSIRINSRGTIWVAAITGVFIALQLFKNDVKPLQLINTRLEREEQILDSIMKVQREIAASLRTIAKDSVKKIYVLKK
jgi:hypothetical protein